MELIEEYHDVVNPHRLRIAVKRVVGALRADKTTAMATHIVATGVSGQSVAWPVSYILEKPVAIVRKACDKSHATNKVNGYGVLGNYIIIDDCVASGDTMHHIIETIDTEWTKKTHESTAKPYPRPICLFAILFNQNYRTKVMLSEKYHDMYPLGIPCKSLGSLSY